MRAFKDSDKIPSRYNTLSESELTHASKESCWDGPRPSARCTMAKLWRGLHTELPNALVEAVESLSAMAELEGIEGLGHRPEPRSPLFKAAILHHFNQ